MREVLVQIGWMCNNNLMDHGIEDVSQNISKKKIQAAYTCKAQTQVDSQQRDRIPIMEYLGTLISLPKFSRTLTRKPYPTNNLTSQQVALKQIIHSTRLIL